RPRSSLRRLVEAHHDRCAHERRVGQADASPIDDLGHALGGFLADARALVHADALGDALRPDEEADLHFGRRALQPSMIDHALGVAGLRLCEPLVAEVAWSALVGHHGPHRHFEALGRSVVAGLSGARRGSPRDPALEWSVARERARFALADAPHDHALAIADAAPGAGRIVGITADQRLRVVRGLCGRRRGEEKEGRRQRSTQAAARANAGGLGQRHHRLAGLARLRGGHDAKCRLAARKAGWYSGAHAAPADALGPRVGWTRVAFVGAPARRVRRWRESRRRPREGREHDWRHACHGRRRFRRNDTEWWRPEWWRPERRHVEWRKLWKRRWWRAFWWCERQRR